jgi:hypothetical protein
MKAVGRWWVVAVLGTLSACGSSADGDGADQGAPLSAASVQALEGIYEVSSFTRNEAACEVGASVLSSLKDHYFVIFARVVLGTQTLELVSCGDEANCRMVAQQGKTNSPYSFEYGLTLSSSESDAIVTGFSATSGSSFESASNLCSRTYVTHRLTSATDGSVHVESRTTPLADAPKDDGVCWVEPEDQKAEAAGKPCAELRVIDAARIADL